MKILFVHQNFPGQYKHLAPFLAAQGHEVIGLGEHTHIQRNGASAGVKVMAYPAPQGAGEGTHVYLRGFEASIRRGQNVARALMQLKKHGWIPDVVCAHPGWGETLFIKDVFPETRMVAYLEFYYQANGSDVNFDPAFPSGLDDALRIRIRNSVLLHTLAAMDVGMAPTLWQRDQFPPMWRERIAVIHDGIDCNHVQPNPTAQFTLPNGKVLTRADEVVTFVNRNLEPYRGFHVFMRALPDLLKRRPHAQIILVGGDEVSYGRMPAGGRSWREVMMKEVGDQLDMSRVHFVGKQPYAHYLSMLQISSVHAYLTYPFVLSWSMLESMAAGCLLVASDTQPVREAITHGQNGLLVPFFDTAAWSATLAEALERQAELAPLRVAARETILQKYQLHDCLASLAKLVTGEG